MKETADLGNFEGKYLKEIVLSALENGRGNLSGVGVYSGLQREPSANIVEFSEDGAGNKVLVHLSDEKLRHRRGIYSSFSIVFRNYFDPRLSFRRNVFQLPLGWTFSFSGSEPTLRSSQHLWSFCGAVKTDRRIMLDSFAPLDGGFVHIASGWDSHDQLAPAEMRKIYESSTFVLCPQGNAHVDSFRVMEALQSGSVPVTVKFLGKDFFRYTFGDHPFIVANDWGHAAELVAEFRDKPDEARVLREKVATWYRGYVGDLSWDIAAIGRGERRRGLKSAFFQIQRNAAFDIPLQARVSLRFRKYRK